MPFLGLLAGNQCLRALCVVGGAGAGREGKAKGLSNFWLFFCQRAAGGEGRGGRKETDCGRVLWGETEMGTALSNLFVDPKELPQDGNGMVQLVFLMAVYGYVLFTSSNMISDGSELLLLVPSLAGIVGSVVLPILGAVPDGAIVLFSGLGPDAQKQLSVGVGALAGSTIMLLTIPWFLSILAGRVSLDRNGKGAYKAPAGAKLSPPGSMSLTRTGVNCGPSIAIAGKIMVITSLAYIIIQGPAFGLSCGLKSDDNKCKSKGERWWAFAGLIYAFLSFVGYLWYQVKTSDDEQSKDKVDATRKKAIQASMISLSGAFAQELEMMSQPNSAGTALLSETNRGDRLRSTLKTFFNKYDRDGNGSIDSSELILLLSDLGEKPTNDEVADMMTELDTDNDGTIDFEEFAVGCLKLIQRRTDGDHASAAERGQMRVTGAINEVHDAIGDSDDDDSEEEEMPEDLRTLSPEEQQRKIKMRSAWLMGLGTVLVLLFSDPMVDVLSEFGARTHIPPFYISFVLAPLASNASELIAAFNYAAKKTKKTITISLSTLLGAACMNNSFCLAIFLAIVWARSLKWIYSAETISIVGVQLIMAFFAFKKTHTLLSGIVVLTLYPLSIIAVWGIERAGLN
ncbi:Ca2:Cation Antiporter family [Thecamonas trahens ATCC 50062]|uniref:Ca2:Cation Antiporter family n=1 Tax=Thecamonas trahens ATCC 50062 TaxID=461836 RepID=A0A0L0DBP1_THETB|nr:Ca2:Cation Antiporter family [Thecamonas trahens ATCC 50062]KNC49757.1 Ca2:Cation Antiporter family [Thecamonas trahens ATCC 50062]|eukprot:XP_013757543.1 Ca2:Cation Antiporter family [Thecamonas trahens ATCC 50062]